MHEGEFSELRRTQAFKSNNLERCFNILADLDEILTGIRCATGLESSWRRQIAKFLKEYQQDEDPDEIFHLSDSGLSRLEVHVDFDGSGKIISLLTDSSQDYVKEKWDSIK